MSACSRILGKPLAIQILLYIDWSILLPWVGKQLHRNNSDLLTGIAGVDPISLEHLHYQCQKRATWQRRAHQYRRAATKTNDYSGYIGLYTSSYQRRIDLDWDWILQLRRYLKTTIIYMTKTQAQNSMLDHNSPNFIIGGCGSIWIEACLDDLPFIRNTLQPTLPLTIIIYNTKELDFWEE